MRVIKLLSAWGIIVSTIGGANAQAIDWTKIDGIFGRTQPSAAPFIATVFLDQTCR
jgi:hypothetical protein